MRSQQFICTCVWRPSSSWMPTSAKCFDRINHEALLDKLGTFPQMRRAVRAWLKAGILDGEELFPTSEGTPQGGVISPLLMNVALHGFATAIEGAFPTVPLPARATSHPVETRGHSLCG